MSLITHYEGRLGAVECGWSRDSSGVDLPFQVARFPRGNRDGTVAFATLGLSRTALRSPASGKDIRQELLMIVPDRLRSGTIPALLQQIGTGALNGGTALLRGDVLGPRGVLVSGSTMQAIYVAAPAYFPDEFATCEVNGQDVVITWLVPISNGEARYVRERGWRAFEELLVEVNPDLSDIFREPMLLS